MYKELLKQGIRFTTSKGQLSVEQLLQLPATDINIKFLDVLAVSLSEQYENSKGKSFVTKKTKKDRNIKLQLDVVLDILGDMVDTVEAQKESQSNKAELQELLAIKAERQKEAKRSMSDEDLDTKIKRLSK